MTLIITERNIERRVQLQGDASSIILKDEDMRNTSVTLVFQLQLTAPALSNFSTAGTAYICLLNYTSSRG